MSSRRWARFGRPIFMVLAMITEGLAATGGQRPTDEPVVRVDYRERLTERQTRRLDVDRHAAETRWRTMVDIIDRATVVIDDVQRQWLERGRRADLEPREPLDDGTLVFSRVRDGDHVPPDVAREREAIERVRTAGILEELRAWARDPIGMRPIGDRNGPMFRDHPDELGDARRLTQLRVASMRLALREGDLGEVADAFTDVLALARAFSGQTNLLDQLVAGAMFQLATRELRQELTESRFPEPVARRLLDALTAPAWGASLELAVERERLVFRDLVQRVFSDDGHGDGVFVPGAAARLAGVSGAEAPPEVIGSRRDHLETHDAQLQPFIAAARRGMEPGWLRLEVASVDDPALPLVDQMIPAVDTLFQQAVMAAFHLEATRVMVAIEIYHDRHGTPPLELAELTPEILPTLPLDPMNGRPFVYGRRPDGSYALHGCGADGVDHGGAFPERDPRGLERGNDTRVIFGRNRLPTPQ
ncbi:MAG: hypothetical protein HKO59_10415 [Phycisphaerales bacterium]|nr:hypothetical protein [Phycisphaerales bacterium]